MNSKKSNFAVKILAALFLSLVFLCQAQAEVYTITTLVSKPPIADRPDKLASQVEVPAGYTAEVVSCQINRWDEDNPRAYHFYYTKSDGAITNRLDWGGYITGPATIFLDSQLDVTGYESLQGYSSYQWATIRIEPQTYPPNKTLSIGEGTNAVMVTMECSSDLKTWITCTNGFYGGTNTALFFRINGTVLNP